MYQWRSSWSTIEFDWFPLPPTALAHSAPLLHRLRSRCLPDYAPESLSSTHIIHSSLPNASIQCLVRPDSSFSPPHIYCLITSFGKTIHPHNPSESSTLGAVPQPQKNDVTQLTRAWNIWIYCFYGKDIMCCFACWRIGCEQMSPATSSVPRSFLNKHRCGMSSGWGICAVP